LEATFVVRFGDQETRPYVVAYEVDTAASGGFIYLPMLDESLARAMNANDPHALSAVAYGMLDLALDGGLLSKNPIPILLLVGEHHEFKYCADLESRTEYVSTDSHCSTADASTPMRQ
jgi:hypothetical protein